MTGADVRDIDPGDGRFTPSAPQAPAWSPAASTAAPPTIDSSEFAGWPEIVEHLREGLVLCGPDGVVWQVSPVAQRLLPEIVVGGSCAVFDALDGSTAEIVRNGRRLRVRRVPLSAGPTCWYVEDVSEDSGPADELAAERARSAFLAVVGEKLGNPLHPDRAAAAVVRLAVPTLAEAAVLILAPRSGRARWWRARRAEDDLPTLDRGVLAAAELPAAVIDSLHGVQPHTVDWLAEQAVEAGWLPGIDAADASVRLVALPGRDAPVGVLLVARPAAHWYTDDDLDLLRAFADRAGAALTTALLYRNQAEVADTLQASLLPVEPAEVPGVQWGTAYRPAQAGLRIGGDFYGSHRLPDGGSVFFLGDVSGKGVEAAVFTGQLRQCLHALHRIEAQPARLLRLLNDALLESTLAHGQGRFATMVLGVVRPHRDGGLVLTLAGGGHLPPLVVRSTGEVEQLPLNGMLIGVVPDPRVSQVSTRLAPGETCLLYSDGVTEARGGRRGAEQLGTERLMQALTGCQRMPAPALAERVEQITCDWLAQRDHDDIAVLALRATGTRPHRHLHAVPTPTPVVREGATTS
ncbi:PP2C family protein-serine/threonine phosphatase [Micromonospora maris]|uniref:Histidine kinase n=1 Tax=Micromonospora maris TaxID=1003110 RepID=A0A9X0I1L9_9ACTN|nr:PP2C family protein-serine/threonine phosphatase [Micromonospora maris]AEB45785.1 protein serine/threonine phosphatase [Micromonospora maris AB-18-032]KUJ45119.1 histidine kinase [Micromonospora maris]